MRAERQGSIERHARDLSRSRGWQKTKAVPGIGIMRDTPPNPGVQVTASSVRCAPASGRGSGLALCGRVFPALRTPYLLMGDDAEGIYAFTLGDLDDPDFLPTSKTIRQGEASKPVCAPPTHAPSTKLLTRHSGRCYR